MVDKFHILTYPSSASFAKELAERLRLSGREADLELLGEERPLTADKINQQVTINLLIVKDDDMSALRQLDWSDFPQNNTIRRDYGLSVAFCINCKEVIPQLSDYFLVKSTIDSAEVVRSELIQLHNRYFQTSKGRYCYFVGRNSEIEQFQNLLYSERATMTNALVVSGRPGVGREAYVRECIRQNKGDRDYEPFTLSLGKNCNIELFLIQLNSVCRSYTEEDLLHLLSLSNDEKIEASLRMLNKLFRADKYLLLYDDGASCIRYNRVLSDWFKSVVSHPKLIGGIHLYVISNISVNYSRIKTEENVAFITLYGLTLSDRKKLLYKQLSALSLSLPEDLVHFIAESLSYSPNQLMNITEDIKQKDPKRIKENIGEYKIVGDKKILTMVKSYDTDDHPEARNVLVLLSRIEYVNRSFFRKVFPDSIKEVDAEIDRFMADGIVERFGEWMDLIRLDGAISDYMRRNKIDYRDKSLQSLVTEKLSELIEEAPPITEDYSAYIEKLKGGLRQGRIEKESYLVPSVLVNTIAESYDEKKWALAIKLCEEILEKQPDYFDDVYNEIKYWYCLSLARVQNADKFYQYVGQIHGADYHFLKGFFLRIGKKFSNAEDEYKKALNMNPSLARAKREMVLVLQSQHKFTAALEMAEINYERDPENAYHIHAYFRCLVRKRNITAEERLLLKRFIEDPNNLFKSKYYLEGMDFEYKRFIDRSKPDFLLPLAAELLSKYKNIAYINDVVDDYYVSQGMKSHLAPIDISEEFNF